MTAMPCPLWMLGPWIADFHTYMTAVTGPKYGLWDPLADRPEWILLLDFSWIRGHIRRWAKIDTLATKGDRRELKVPR